MISIKKSTFVLPNARKDSDLSNQDFRQFLQYLVNLDSDVNALFNITNGQIRFGTASNLKRGENIFGQWAKVADTGTANTEFAVTHSLSTESIGIVPANYLVTSINKGGVVYLSGTTWTTTTAYFKCTTANTAVTIFLMP